MTMEVVPPTRVIQVTNLAPQANRDHMHTLFAMLSTTGSKSCIEDVRVYPSHRGDVSGFSPSQVRVAFVKFVDHKLVDLSQHLSNTVFIDRAIQVSTVQSGLVPDEEEGLQMAHAPNNKSSSHLPAHVVNRLEGVAPNAVIMTHDPKLEECGLPAYPPLPASTPSEKVEEIRRTVCVSGLDSTVSAQQCIENFSEAGEVKFFRHCTREQDPVKYALVEFTEQSSVIAALKMNDRQLGMTRIKVTHALQAITKPQVKSNEAAQKEIEEAMTRVKEAQSLVSAAVDPLMGILTGITSSTRTSRSRSRSRSKRRSRERSSYSRRRSRSRDRRRRSRSRSRDRRRRSRTRSRDRRRRSRTRSRDRRKRSRSRDKKRSKRSRSRSREKRKSEKDKDKEESKKTSEEEPTKAEEKPAEDGEKVENGTKSENGEKASSSSKKRSRSRSRDRKRSRSRDRKRRSRSRSKEKKRSKKSRRSPSRERKRSRSRDRKHRSRSRDRKHKKRSRSKERVTTNKISRDYDQEEKGFETEPQVKKTIVNSEPETEKKVVHDTDLKQEENLQAEDMEISNSP